MTWAPAEINLAASGFVTTATATALAWLAACLLVSDMARAGDFAHFDGTHVLVQALSGTPPADALDAVFDRLAGAVEAAFAPGALTGPRRPAG